MRRQTWALWGMLGMAALLTNCGGRPPPAEAPAAAPVPATEQSAPASAEESLDAEAPAAGAPSPPPAPAPGGDALRDDELAQAERDLARADADLSALTNEKGAAKSGEGAATKPAARSGGASACTTTCKAFASLVRARDAICRIDGSDGARCTRANDIVSKHATKRDACGCEG